MSEEKDQQSVWQEHTAGISVTDIINQYHSPQAFQIEFSDFLNQLCSNSMLRSSLEAGCEAGITTMLLDSSIKKSFLDLNKDIIEKVENACEQLNIPGKFFHQDMMSMKFEDKTFDLIFNAGVIEHFNEQERIEILREYSRVLSDEGRLVIAIPNHFTPPYRWAYVWKKEWQKGRRWPWPSEYKIYDLEDEINACNLVLDKRVTLAHDNLFDFWGKNNPIKLLLKIVGLFVKYEGYLTVLVIRKQTTSEQI